MVGIETGGHVLGRRPLVALAGNPNTGKSTLFNRLTGSQARVGNYAGVTVELAHGRWALPDDAEVDVVDIPGCYSLLSCSAEEQIAVDHLLGVSGQRRPDVVVACVDASNLARNLYLVLQLQELGLKVVVALTMVDELDGQVHAGALSASLHCAVVPISPRTGEGLPALSEAVERALQLPEPGERFVWQPSAELTREIDRTRTSLPRDWPHSRGVALWALMSWDEESEHVPEEVRRRGLAGDMAATAIDDEVVHARYRFIDAELAATAAPSADRSGTRAADAILIHPVWGLGIFLGLMFVLFQSLFAWADPAITLLETLFSALSSGLRAVLPEGLLTDLLIEGGIGGVGSVAAFLPQILLLFFMLGLMEDSGYMARVAYLMDRIMRAMGLHGRAFVPMLSGFACAIPAIMATRTMERRRDRLLTMMVVPLMTCSARLPVYTLLIGAFFPAATVMGILPVQGLLMVSMYVLSVLMALLAAWALSKTLLPAPPTPLVLELPPYRRPRPIDVARMMWRRTRAFLTEAGGVILVSSMILWVLLTFPRLPETHVDTATPGGEQAALVSTEAARHEAEALRQSYAGRIGRQLEPVIEPLGFDWKIGVGLLGAFAAREVFVSTMGIVYSAGADADEESVTLRQRMRQAVRADGRPLYTPLTALSLMVFFVLACQCVSTLAVVKRETHSYRWPLFLLAYMSALAWAASFVVYQGGRWLGYA